MTTNSLWGKLPENLPSLPSNVLQEQGTALGQGTNWTIHGEVEVKVYNNAVIAEFYIVADALNKYKIQILWTRYGLDGYPAALHSQITNYETECKDEAEFRSELAKMLQSEAIQKIVGTLLAESKRVMG